MATRAAQIELFLDSLVDPTTGAIAGGYTAYFYAAGTSTAKNVWTEKEKSNPYSSYQLDSAGKALLYGDGEYKIIVKNLDATAVLTLDNLKIQANTFGISTQNGDYTVTPDDDMVLVNSASDDVTINLQTVANFSHPVTIKKISAANTVTIDPYSTQTIDSDATVDLTADNQVLVIYPDTTATKWRRGYDTSTSGLTPVTVSATTDLIKLGDANSITVKNLLRVEFVSQHSSSLATAVSAIGATPTNLIVDVDTTVSGNLTVPATITLQFTNGSIITVSGSQTLTLNCVVDAPPQQIFVETGTIVFGAGSTQDIRVEWWGVTSAAMQKAFDHIRDDGVVLSLLPRTYTMTTVLTLVRAASADATRFHIKGNGAKLDWSASGLTTGTLFTLGGTWTDYLHDKGWIRVEDLEIYGPEDPNPASAVSADTDIIGLLLTAALGPVLDNVKVRRCYIGIKTYFTWHFRASDCDFTENWINAFITENSTLGYWLGCDFHEGRYGVVIQPDNSNNVFQQVFIQPRFETLYVGMHIDPGGNGYTVNGITVDNPYFESITYDLVRLGTSWTFSADPSARGSNALGILNNTVFRGGFWDFGLAWSATHKPMTFSGSANMFGGDFSLPFGKENTVNPEDHVGTHNSFKFLTDRNLGAATAYEEEIGIGEGYVRFQVDGTVDYQLGNIASSSAVTDNGTGNWTVAFQDDFLDADSYIATPSYLDSDATLRIAIIEQLAGSCTIKCINNAGAAADPTRVMLHVKGRM